MPDIEELRRALEERKKKEAEIDMDRVQDIVKKMKKREEAAGIPTEEITGELGELRAIIAEGAKRKIVTRSVEEMTQIKNPLAKLLAKLYLVFGLFFKPLGFIIVNLPPVKKLGIELYSANMLYTVSQYLAVTTVGSVMMGGFFGLVFAASFIVIGQPIQMALLIGVLIATLVFLMAAFIFILVPSQTATKRGKEIDRELPFALRHIASELRAGIGLFKALQAVAVTDYGILSDEFTKTVREVDEGTSVEEAMTRLSFRVKSDGLKKAMRHMTRALRTGGNLADIMKDIAEDASYEGRMSVRDFASKMNFIGVIFIFVAIVIPVFVAILGAIRNAPLSAGGGGGFFAALPLTPPVIAGVYIIGMPLLLGLLVMYLNMIKPRV